MPPAGLRLFGGLALGLLASACASAREVPRAAGPEPDLTPVLVVDGTRQEALLDFRGGIAALRDGYPDVAYERLLEVVDRCGSAPLGQQALLMLAVAELDPANPDPRPHLAVEASARLALRTSDTTWTGRVARALYLLSRRLAPPPSHLDRMDVDALRTRIERATEARWTPRAGCAATWPGGAAAEADLPDVNVTSYPVQTAGLRRQIHELRREVERLRRLAGQGDVAP